ncbi:MAG: ABC transporter ATP-binding protein [Pseudomonadales bacterium]
MSMRASLWRLRFVVGKHKARLTSGVVAFGIARAFESMVPFLTAVSINRMVEGNYDLTWPVVGILGAVIARYMVVTFARFQVRKSGLNVAFDLRQKLYASLQDQGGEFFARHTIGDMMTRAVADIALIQRLIAMGTILVVILVYASLFGFAFMLYFSPALTLLLLPPMPFVFWYARYSSRRMGLASIDVQNRLSDLGTHVQENLSGIRTIQAMVQEENEIKRFAQTNQQYADAFYEQGRINSAMTAWMPTLAAVCSLTILGYGGYLVLEGELRVGDFVAFFMFVNMVVQPFRVAGFIVNLFQRAAVASDRLFEVIDLEPEITDAPSGQTPEYIRGEIEIRDLTFAYSDSDAVVLSGINLHVEAGETVAIMGRVGAGKTTLLKQLVRLLDPSPGSILIDGHDVHDYPLSQIRAQLAMVPQDPFLFGEPLKDNLTYDDPNRALDLIWQAASSADLRNTIENFPEQLDTLVGERGVTLSGGQKQRATLARGLIRNAPVLILDDCFSAVDTETEEHILSELRRLRHQQTTLLVSHRVSTARHADRIVMLDEGRIVETGSHDDLLAAGGYYAELERVQREGAENEQLSGMRIGQ